MTRTYALIIAWGLLALPFAAHARGSTQPLAAVRSTWAVLQKNCSRQITTRIPTEKATFVADNATAAQVRGAPTATEQGYIATAPPLAACLVDLTGSATFAVSDFVMNENGIACYESGGLVVYSNMSPHSFGSLSGAYLRDDCYKIPDNFAGMAIAIAPNTTSSSIPWHNATSACATYRYCHCCIANGTCSDSGKEVVPHIVGGHLSSNCIS